MRILFTTVALPGHFFPLVPLAWAGRALGHEVLVATPEGFAEPVLRAGLPVASTGRVADFVDLVRDGWDPGRAHQRRYANGSTFGTIAARSLPGVEHLVRSWRPDLVVSERAEFAGRIAAARHGLPFVELRWGVALLDEYRAAAADVLAGQLGAVGLADFPAPVLVLDPWPPSLRLPHAQAHRSLRHVSYNGDAPVPDWVWLTRDRPRICLTLGTVLPRLGSDAAVDTAIPIVRALARERVELVVAVDDKIVATWPALPPAVRHAGRLPLAQVLRACDAVIHHGGQGTALTALDAGTPQLVTPVFDDQLDNSDAIVRAGAGLSVPADRISPGAVVEGCRELLDTERFGRNARRIAEEIAAQPSPAAVARSLVEMVAFHR